MSWKIYDAYKFNGSVAQLKGELRKIAAKQKRRLLSDLAKDDFRVLHIFISAIKKEGNKDGDDFWYFSLQRFLENARNDQFRSLWDEIYGGWSVVFYKKKILVKFFNTNIVIQGEKWEDYHYQNSSDFTGNPQAEKDWKAILSKYNTFWEVGFEFRFFEGRELGQLSEKILHLIQKVLFKYYTPKLSDALCQTELKNTVEVGSSSIIIDNDLIEKAHKEINDKYKKKLAKKRAALGF